NIFICVRLFPGIQRLSSDFIKWFAWGVPLRLFALSRGKSFSLNGNGMEQFGPEIILQIFQITAHRIHIMPLNWPVIIKTKSLKKTIGGTGSLHLFFQLRSYLLHFFTG